jgi:hypothetical protein
VGNVSEITVIAMLSDMDVESKTGCNINANMREPASFVSNSQLLLTVARMDPACMVVTRVGYVLLLINNTHLSSFPNY